METEYTLSTSSRQRLPSFVVFAKSLAVDVPLVENHQNPNRLFLANGGSISLEAMNSEWEGNLLLETATPECKSPEDLLCYQLALEHLLVKHTMSVSGGSETNCIKGVSDAFGKCFGQHESYEMLFATGWALFGWRAGLVLMLPLLILYQLLATLSIVAFSIVGDLCHNVDKLVGYIRISKAGNREVDGSKPVAMYPHPYLVTLASSWMRVLHFPIVLALWINLQCFALWRHRHAMSAFLASRSVLEGAGYVDAENRFWISQRAALVNRMIGFGSYSRSRPLFRCDCLLRGLCETPSWRLGNYSQLFRKRQRIEIAIGDSGMCQQSQYIRVGATALVLDMIESREVNPVPRLRNPIEATKQFAKDWMLVRSVSCTDHQARTALEIQNIYVSAIKGFLSYHANVPEEAWRIYHQWQTTLNQLAPIASGQHDASSLLGRVDWVSKLWLMKQLPNVTEWANRKKMDLRYHELSAEGYSNRLNATLEIAPLISSESIIRSCRMPPVGTPAMVRGYLIREFSATDAMLKIGWNRAETWIDGRKKIHRLHP
jgi:Pup amidohydrolase